MEENFSGVLSYFRYYFGITDYYIGNTLQGLTWRFQGVHKKTKSILSFTGVLLVIYKG